MENWYEILGRDDEQILAECSVSSFLGKGKGGQKRNKTSNAVRVRLGEFVAGASGSRSKTANVKEALRKLKMTVALHVDPARLASPPLTDLLPAHAAYVKGGGLRINPSNPVYAAFAGNMLDLFISSRSWFSVAEILGITPTQLKKWAHSDPQILRAVQSVLSPQEQGEDIISQSRS